MDREEAASILDRARSVQVLGQVPIGSEVMHEGDDDGDNDGDSDGDNDEWWNGGGMMK